jgi:hypothetical protein
MKRIVVFSMLLLIAVLTLQAQTPIAGWEIKGMGFSEDNLINVETVAVIIVVQGGEIYFNAIDMSTNETIMAVTIKDPCLDQTAAKNDSYNGIRSDIVTLDNLQRKGTLCLSITKTGKELDIFHFDFGDGKQICYTGSLVDKKMAGNILKLCIAIDTLKKRGLTTAPLEHIMKTD